MDTIESMDDLRGMLDDEIVAVVRRLTAERDELASECQRLQTGAYDVGYQRASDLHREAIEQARADLAQLDQLRAAGNELASASGSVVVVESTHETRYRLSTAIGAWRALAGARRH